MLLKNLGTVERFSLKTLFKRSRYYQNIDDCTAFVFNEVISKGETKLLCISGKYEEKKAFEAWEKIIEQYINTFGIPTGYKHYLEKRLTAIKMYDRSYVKGQKGYEIHGKMIEKEADMLLSSRGGVKFHVLAAKVSKGLGFHVDPKKTSVRQFYSYVEMLSKQ